MSTNDKSNSICRMIGVTFLYILGAAGVVFFIDLIRDPNLQDLNKAMWVVMFGIIFAAINGYKVFIRPGHKKK